LSTMKQHLDDIVGRPLEPRVLLGAESAVRQALHDLVLELGADTAIEWDVSCTETAPTVLSFTYRPKALVGRSLSASVDPDTGAVRLLDVETGIQVIGPCMLSASIELAQFILSAPVDTAPPTHDPTPEARAREAAARAAHEANRAYCQALGDDSQLPWDSAPEWQKASARLGVENILQNGVDPEQSHKAWVEHKASEGWSYGPVKDAEKKQHPCMVAYEDLPAYQKNKDHIFIDVVTKVHKHTLSALEQGGADAA